MEEAIYESFQQKHSLYLPSNFADTNSQQNGSTWRISVYSLFVEKPNQFTFPLNPMNLEELSHL